MFTAVQIPASEIRLQVKKICESTELVNKKQLCRLFSYLVEETLEGREDQLKGFNIGVEVFQQGEKFNPEQNPIVRIHAGRLRRMLRLYYLDIGINDKLRIEIPKGRYIPHFSYKKQDSLEKDQVSDANIWPTITVVPFKNLTGNPDKDYFAFGFAEELSIELTKFDELIVSGSTRFSASGIDHHEKNNLLREKGVRFLIEGGINIQDSLIKISVWLIDTDTNEQLWAERYTKDLHRDNIIEIQQVVAHEIAVVLGSEYGIIPQRLFQESRKEGAADFGSYTAILKFHYFQATLGKEAMKEAFTSLKGAIKKDPDNAVATALLASIYATFYQLDLPLEEDAYQQLGLLSQKALDLDPNNLSVRVVLAAKYFTYGEKENLLVEVEKCLSMYPNSSTIRYGTLGQYLSLCGEWDRGKEILDQVMHMNVSFPLYFHGASCLYYYRKNDFKSALEEAKLYKVPTVFWAPLLRAASMGQLGMISEAGENLGHMSKLKPEFKSNARVLLGRFIYEKELIEKIIHGLKMAGMDFHKLS